MSMCRSGTASNPCNMMKLSFQLKRSLQLSSPPGHVGQGLGALAGCLAANRVLMLCVGRCQEEIETRLRQGLLSNISQKGEKRNGESNKHSQNDGECRIKCSRNEAKLLQT